MREEWKDVGWEDIVWEIEFWSLGMGLEILQWKHARTHTQNSVQMKSYLEAHSSYQNHWHINVYWALNAPGTRLFKHDLLSPPNNKEGNFIGPVL